MKYTTAPSYTAPQNRQRRKIDIIVLPSDSTPTHYAQPAPLPPRPKRRVNYAHKIMNDPFIFTV